MIAFADRSVRPLMLDSLLSSCLFGSPTCSLCRMHLYRGNGEAVLNLERSKFLEHPFWPEFLLQFIILILVARELQIILLQRHDDE